MKKPDNLLSPEEIELQLTALKLPSMRKRFHEIMNNDLDFEGWSFEEKLGFLVKAEVEDRAARRTERLLSRSGLRELETYADARLDLLEPQSNRRVNVELLKRLLTCRWIKGDRAYNVIVSGPTGVGKTWAMTLLGRAAAEQGLSVKYLAFSDLLNGMDDARLHHDSEAYMRRLNKHRLLIIDDFCLMPVTQQQAGDLLALLMKRVGFLSTAIGGQLDPSEWLDVMGGSGSAESIVDRLTNSSYDLKLSGPSMREKKRPQ